jgi:hypothetical protein
MYLPNHPTVAMQVWSEALLFGLILVSALLVFVGLVHAAFTRQQRARAAARSRWPVQSATVRSKRLVLANRGFRISVNLTWTWGASGAAPVCPAPEDHPYARFYLDLAGISPRRQETVEVRVTREEFLAATVGQAVPYRTGVYPDESAPTYELAPAAAA